MSSPMRIGGLATGMDTDSMVKQLMDAEKIKLTKFNATKQVKVWTQEAYNNTNKDIANFIIDTKKDLELMKTTSSGSFIGGSSSTFSWVKKATVGNSSVVDATTTSSATTGTHTIKVNALASGVNAGSQSAVKKADGTTTATSDTTLGELQGGVAGDCSITLNGKAITLNSGMKLSEVISAINTETQATGVKASYDSNTGRMFLSTTSTGASSKIDITDNTANKLFTGVGSVLKTDLVGAKTGTDANIDFDGALGITYSSNQFIINGISMSVKDTGTTTVKVDTDVDSVYSKIKGFVEKYNTLMDGLNKTTTEKKYRSFQPLTDEQKEAMKDDEVKLWEGKAKSGLLNNDGNIIKMVNNTRSSLYDSVYDTYSSADTSTGKVTTGYTMLTEIGIATGSYQEKGKLVIDENKLKAALANNVDGVMNVLFKTSDITDSQATSDPAKAIEKSKESGVLTRIYDNLVNGMKDIINKSGTGENAPLYRQVKSNLLIDFVTKSGSISTLDKDILSVQKQITSENSRLSKKETAYYNRFAQLEKAMSKMNSQSSWLAGQMG